MTAEESCMKADIEQILNAIPDQVKWGEIVQFEHIDGRVLIANSIYGDVVGVGEGSVEWCPNPDTPKDARLVWWWVVRPDLGAAIAYEASDVLRQQIADYISEHSSDG